MISSILAAVAIAAATAIAIWEMYGMSPLWEGVPGWTGYTMAATLGYSASAGCLARALWTRAARLSMETWTARSAWEWTFWLIPAGLAAMPLLLWRSPYLFNRVAEEDGIAETFTAISLFAATGIAIWAAGLQRDNRRMFCILGFAVAAFLIGAEEISWGQRIFGFATPEAFASNLQQEANLHNFHTGFIEAVYYFFGGFVFLVAIPALQAATTSAPLWQWPITYAFRPSARLIPSGAAISSMNYDMWHSTGTQLAFWGTLAILGTLAARKPQLRTSALVALTLCVAVQAALLALGQTQLRSWDITEYKETAIAFAFLLHAWDLRKSVVESR